MSDEIRATTISVENGSPTAVAGEYVGESVQVLRDAAHIRERPGMYVGDTSTKGLHHLAYELVYNSVDEALAGHCNAIHVEVDVDGSISVADDGRGIPVDLHPVEKKPTLEVVMTMAGAGAKFDKRTYKTSAGLHGIGAKAVTALSEWTEAEVRRNGRVYVQEYERGRAVTEVMDKGAAAGRTGTKVTFKPDPEIFDDATFDYDTLENRLRELAFLNKGLTIHLIDKRTSKSDTFHFAGGVGEYVEYMNRDEEVLPAKPLHIEKTVGDVYVEASFQWTTGETERVWCYANNALNPGGGTHLSGFRTALTRTLGAYGDREKYFKEGLKPVGEDFREGLTAVVSVHVPEPQFESQTKIRLNNPEIDGIVSGAIGEALAKYLEENPKDAKRIMNKVVTATEAREAAAKARKALKERKSILSSGGLPGKLYDCTGGDLNESELFLVEGQSAGGTAESGRDRRFQAILPLRGKVLNVEKARVEKVLGNEEIRNLISAVGVDIENPEDVSGRRYGKVVVLTDADVDGQHIRTLLLTFFYRQMRKMIEEGHIYVARPPLYKVTEKKNVRFIQTLEEMATQLMERGLRGTRLEVLDVTGTPPAAPINFEGERLTNLVQVLGHLDDHLQILERRGANLVSFFQKLTSQGLPVFHVFFAGHEYWFHSSADVDKFRQEESARLGRDVVIGDEWRKPSTATQGGQDGPTNGNVLALYVQEWHEVHAINRGLTELKAFGLGPKDLLPLPRVAGREPPTRFLLHSGDHERSLQHLRDLPGEIRRQGERGLSLMRFKGLGEMDAEELWDTTLDPARRTLVQVKLEDAIKAEEMFRTLMGEKVEPRRDFIVKHALEVKDIDYHGA